MNGIGVQRVKCKCFHGVNRKLILRLSLQAGFCFMAEEQTKDLRDFIDGFRRRRRKFVVIFSVLFSISLLVAFLWPPTFRSTATILIEEQGIPSDMVRSTITTYAWQRIQTISQRVMTRANLLEIVDKHKLYASKRARETSEEIVGRMRQDIKLAPISSGVIDPRSGRATAATIAFTLSFDGENPAVTQKVASELTTLYLNENIKSRTEKVAETYDFMTSEVEKLNQQIAEYETQLAIFKEKNANRLPEHKELYLQQMNRAETELRDLQNEIRSLEERKVYIESQLSQVQPGGPAYSTDGQPVLNTAARLKFLKTEYAMASVKYSPEHPDVIRLKREIEGLEQQTGSVSERQEQAKKLSQFRGELAAAREKYSNDHPDVINLTRQIEAMEASLKESSELPEVSVAAEKPDNPIYISLKTQLDGIEVGLRTAAVKREQLNAKMADYERRIIQTPQVEREFLNLMRDYNNAREKYRELKAKQMEAQVGQELEKERKGERFSLIDPADIPEEPIKPNRPTIIFLGLILSLGAGFGYIAVAEALGNTVRRRSLAMDLGTTLLSVIPYKENQEDVAKRLKTKRLVITTAAVSLVVMVILVHFLWTPLDVLWFKGLRRADGIISG
jgi:polysaccharide biosynthesis transport protein